MSSCIPCTVKVNFNLFRHFFCKLRYHYALVPNLIIESNVKHKWSDSVFCHWVGCSFFCLWLKRFSSFGTHSHWHSLSEQHQPWFTLWARFAIKTGNTFSFVSALPEHFKLMINSSSPSPSITSNYMLLNGSDSLCPKGQTLDGPHKADAHENVQHGPFNSIFNKQRPYVCS